MKDYYTAQFIKSMERVKAEIGYCLVLSSVLEIDQDTDNAINGASGRLTALLIEYRNQKARQNQPKDCTEPDKPTVSGCEGCPNFDIHMDGQPYCKLSLKAVID